MKANQGKGGKYWSEHGDSYSEWLGTLNRHEDSQAIQEEFKEVVPPGHPALMDGHAEDEEHTDEDTLPPDEDTLPPLDSQGGAIQEEQAVALQDIQK